MGKRSKPSGQNAFLEYYTPILQQTKVTGFDLLTHKNLPVLLFTSSNESRLKTLWQEKNLTWETLPWYPYALKWPSGIELGTKLPGLDEELIYPLNPASLIPVVTLNPKPDEVILDACAAPGGKTIGIYNLKQGGSLIANDLSLDRGKKMHSLFHKLNLPIPTWHSDAATIYQTHPAMFDKILLDAPCSSEKHVYQDASELAKWTPNRIKQLQTRQIALISGLILALKPGGRLVYSTCALTPEENEVVVDKVLNRKGDLIKLFAWERNDLPGQVGLFVDKVNFDLKNVRRILPDDEFDPMFVAIFERL